MAHNLQKEPVPFQAVIAVEDAHCTLLVRWATCESGRLTQHRPEQQAVTRRRTHPIQPDDDSQRDCGACSDAGMRDIGKVPARPSTNKAAQCAALFVFHADISIAGGDQPSICSSSLPLVS